MSALCRSCRAKNSGKVSITCHAAIRILWIPLVLAWLCVLNDVEAAVPQVTTQPQSRTVLEGANHTFQVTASGTAPLRYQWRLNGSALPTATNSILSLTSIQTNLAGLYSVVVTNSEGSVTSNPARLIVRTTNDPVYPAPPSGWAYLYQGAGIASDLTAALDGTWNHELDSWSGDGRGAGNGLPGGLSTTNGIVTMEDAVTSTAGGTFNNRRFYFTHSIAQESTVTNANNLLNDGVTLTFRARLTPASNPLTELTNAPSGLVNNSDGKGMFGIRQSGSSGLLAGFSLGQAVEDTSATATYNFGQPGLHMNQLNGNTRTNNVDPGEPGTPNLLPLDPTVFHEFWITIQDNGSDPGTHRVSVYQDGALTPTVFNITAGTGSDGPATNYLALGMGSTAQRGAMDVDFFGYRPGVVEPSAFNLPVGIAVAPVSQFVATGQFATFNVGVTGTPPYSFQWYRNGAVIPGATNPAYSIGPVLPADAGASFRVAVANEFNAVTSSPPAELRLLGAPVITTQPTSLVATNGDSVTLSIIVSSSVSPSYQWRFNGASIANQTNSMLGFASVSSANAGAYDVVVSNSSGSVTSLVASLTVISFDYGDAPDSGFKTVRASDGARHRVMAGIYLGAAVDVDLDGQASGLANGDDSAGVDDEDGVLFPSAWVAGQFASVQVIASTNGLLNAWVDWNHDGTWNTTGDQIFTNYAVTVGTNTLAFLIPANAAAGNGYARFRFATTGNLSSAGPAADGEVEDYVVSVTPRADLGVSLVASANPVAVNGNLTFSIQVSNSGPSLATSVVLTNFTPGTADFVSVSSSQGSCFQTGDTVACDLGTVSSASTALVNLTLRPVVASSLVLTSQVSSAVSDLVSLNNSASIAVTALAAPVISAQPQSQTVTNGSVAALAVGASGAAPLRYQWYFDGAAMSGQTNATLAIPSAATGNDGTYFVRVTNLVGSVDSLSVTLSVIAPPTILFQPSSLTNLAGSSASFAVTAVGSEPLFYQWRFNGANPLSGEVGPALSFEDVRLTNAGAYSVTVSNAAGVITSAVATLTVVEMDFGDAPIGYPTTLAANGARHRIVPGIRLGATNDFEPVGQADLLATGDDSQGVDDEDGVTFNSPVRTGQNVSISVVASAAGFLNAWVDFNRNTNWSDAGEQIFVNRPLVAGVNNLSFIVPGGASIGSSFARFRFSTTSGLSFVGEAANGEVEDYALTIDPVADVSIVRVSQITPVAVGSNQIYSVVVSNAGPVVATGVSLADALPAGVNYVSSSASQGGCTHSAGTVVCALSSLAVGGTATVSISANVGVEGIIVNSVTVGANQVDINPGNNSSASSATALIPPSIIGQPESQSVNNGSSVTFSVTANGTNPRYQWRRNGTNLAGAILTSLTIPFVQPTDEGAYSVRITNEVGVAVSTTANLSVLIPVSITVPPQSQTVLAGSTVTFTVAASGTSPFSYQWEWNGSDLVGQNGASLVLSGVETNQSGVYRVRVSNAIGSVVSADANLTVLLPPTFTLQPQGQTNPTGSSVTFSTAVIGTEPLRQQWYFNRTNALPLQTNSTLTLTGLLTNRSGDYTLIATNIAGASTSAVATLLVVDMDFGDAPAANGYPTTLAFNGARHRVVPGIRLGANIDFETNGFPSATAVGDDQSGLDDEDGVIIPATLLLGQTASFSITASANGFIDAWIDVNGNGAWNDPGEQVLSSRPVVAGTNVVPVIISSAGTAGSRFARFRFSTVGGLAFDGYAPDGEVEDYLVSLQPAVDLQLGMRDSIDPVSVSSNLTYTISVTNQGPSRAGLVWVTNALPPSFTFVSAATSGGQGFCDTAGSIVYCLLDDMQANAVAFIDLTVRANATGSYTNRAWVFSIAGTSEANPADNTNSQSTVVVGAPIRYGNAAPITVADATTGLPGIANPYPSTIAVSGLTSALYKVTVTVSNISHDFAKDFDLLLVGPRGNHVMLMSDAGASSMTGVSLVFDDSAADPLPSSGVIVSGTYRPSNYGLAADIFPVPAPAGPYGSSLSAFSNTDPNGTWSLYVVDGIVGGLGSIQGGWRLELSTALPIADLALTAAGSSPSVALGSNLVYSVTLTNRGPAIASAVRLTNALPASASFVSATSSLGSCSAQAGNVICDFGSLNVGAGAAVVLTVSPNASGYLTNDIRASGAQLDVVAGNHVAQIVTLVRPATDLVVAQVPSTNLVLLGQALTYTLHVTNRGPNAATSIRLTDTIPSTAGFLTAVASQGSCSNNAGVVTCEMGGLAAGGRAQVALSVIPTLVGLVTNTVVVSSDEIDSLATNNSSTVIQSANVAADLALTVTGGGSSVLVSNLLTYDIVVTNRGPSSALGATLTNILPAGFAFVSASSSIGSCELRNGAVICSMVSLDADSSATIAIRVMAVAPGLWTSTIRVGGSSVDFIATNNAVSLQSEVKQPLFISVQPQGRTVTNGASVVFSVLASGAGSLSYRWSYNGADLAGATNPSLAVLNASYNARGDYRVRVGDGVDVVTSAVATLVVLVPPTISDIASQQINEDSATAIIPFVIGDVDSGTGGLGITTASSDLALIPLSGISITGSGGNRSVRVTPATNQFGSATVILRVIDPNGLSSVDAFVVNVTPVNDPPTISNIADRSSLEDAVVSIPFVVGDVETPVAGLQILVTSTNPTLIPTNAITVSGTGANRTLALRPATNESGSATLTLQVTDTNGVSASDSFVVTVVPINDSPTLNVLTNLTIVEDSGERVVPLSGISAGASNEFQTLVMTAESGNAALITNVTVAYTSPNSFGELRFTPSLNASGNTIVTVRVRDDAGSNNLVVRSFFVTVTPENDSPTLSSISDVVMNENTVSSPIPFVVADVESLPGQLTVSNASSDTNLFPSNSVSIVGSGTNRTLTLAPRTNTHGSATITIRVSDPLGAQVSRSFLATVVQTVFPPSILIQPASQTVTNGTRVTFSITTGGTLPIFYQWKYKGLDLPGATNLVLTLPAAAASNAGAYTIVASNPAGSVVSSPAVLRVLVAPAIGSIARNGAAVEISFSTIVDLSYTVEFSDEPESLVWSQLTTIAGTGGTMVAIDTGALVASRIYRVRVE